MSGDPNVSLSAKCTLQVELYYDAGYSSHPITIRDYSGSIDPAAGDQCQYNCSKMAPPLQSIPLNRFLILSPSKCQSRMDFLPSIPVNRSHDVFISTGEQKLMG
jgi:hypothetical protein